MAEEQILSGDGAVILGATSALGQAVARELAGAGTPLVLVARNADRLQRVADDLDARGAQTATIVADLDDVAGHEEILSSVGEAGGAASWWLFYGSLPVQSDCEADWTTAAASFHTNFISAASLLTRIANRLQRRGDGVIVVVTSVAGDRGRQSNYVYGTAKGALSRFCQGLRNRLATHGIQVMDVRPGFIDTPMTAEIEKSPAVLWATPERVARDIVRAQRRGADVLYTPWFWRYILLLIRLVPERLFKRLSL